MGFSLASLHVSLGDDVRFSCRRFLDRPGAVPELVVDTPGIVLTLRPSGLAHVSDQDLANAEGLAMAAASFLEQVRQLHAGVGSGSAAA